MKKALIAGYYGFGNTGDEAILEALVQEFSKKDRETTVLSANPDETSAKYGVKSYNRKSFFDTMRGVADSDTLVCGGGSLFQDVTSSASLYYYLGLVQMAFLFWKNVHMFSQGIGPIKKKSNRRLFSGVANRVKSISVRDEISLQELKALRVSKPAISLASDAVFLLEPAPKERGRQVLLEAGVDIEEGGFLVGIAVREWNDCPNSAERFAQIADGLIDEFDAKIVFYPFHNPNDLEMTFEIISKMKNKPYIIEKQYRPSEIMSAIGEMDLNIAVRLHALIFSACMGVPMIGISYDPKIDGFLKSMEREPVSLYKDMDWATIKDEVSNIIKNKKEIIEVIKQKAKKSKRLARKSFESLLEVMEK